jgi:CRP/FNR family transcriptional regulator, cyclic AMP receptor protein
MENLERLLQQHDFLKGLEEAQTAKLVSCVKNVRFAPGAFLMREGDEACTFYLLRVGRVALEVDVPGSGPVVMESVEPGDIVGFSWLFPPHRVHLDARAVEHVVALSFDGACLRGKMEADHDLGFALTRRLLAETYKRLQRVRLQRLDVYTG